MRKVIATGSKLRNQFLKTNSQEVKQIYNKQKYICVPVVQKQEEILQKPQDKKVVKLFYCNKIGGIKKIIQSIIYLFRRMLRKF